MQAFQTDTESFNIISLRRHIQATPGYTEQNASKANTTTVDYLDATVSDVFE